MSVPDKPEKATALTAISNEVVAHAKALLAEHDSLKGVPELIPAVALARCIDRHRAVTLLGLHRFADEATALLRGLGRDTQRLEFMAANPGLRKGLAIRWFSEVLDELDDISRQAERAGETGAQDLHVLVAQQRPAVESLRLKHEVATLPVFPTDGANAARAVGQPDDLLDYLLATDASHSGLLAMHRYVRARDATTLEIHLGAPTTRASTAVGDRSARYVARAVAATAVTLEDPRASEYEAMRDDAVARLDALGEDGASGSSEQAAPLPDR